MDDQLVQISAFIGFFFPLVAALVKQQGWSEKANAVVAAVAAVVVALVVTLQQGDVNAENWATSAITLFTAAVAAYAGFYKPTGIDTAIKDATSVKKG
jgi:peptidoglycan/LPS O-acetylase OafA/YrhL